MFIDISSRNFAAKTAFAVLSGIMLQLGPQLEPNRIPGSDSIGKSSWNAECP
jgi:hypothetical protein